MISVIIPVYNEEITIKKILEALLCAEDLEVIVVDGGSSDKTVEFAKQHPVKLIQYIKNRALQLNEGAKAADGDKLLFLHSDCRLEEGGVEAIKGSLDKGFVGGSFTQRIDSGRWIYRFIEGSGNIRAKLFKIFYGDQAIFVRKDIFFKIGGFDDVELFDDILFSKKLKKRGKTRILEKKVYTSPRRWEKQGIVKTTLINWIMSIGFILGLPPNILKKLYYDIR